MSARVWTPEVVEIGNRIAGLNVAQATMLSELLDVVYGIKAQVSPVLVPEPDVVVQPVQPTEFNVVLESFEAAKKIGIIKAVRDNTGLGLKEAKALVESLPKPVKERLPKADADKLKASWKQRGQRFP